MVCKTQNSLCQGSWPPDRVQPAVHRSTRETRVGLHTRTDRTWRPTVFGLARTFGAPRGNRTPSPLKPHQFAHDGAKRLVGVVIRGR